jgi:hypothetical protein
MRYLPTAIVIFTVLAIPASSLAQQEKVVENAGGLSMKSVGGLGQSPTGPKMIGGRPADPSQWRASFFSVSEGARCTATLVGPRALLLAAHCVGDGQPVSIAVEGKEFHGRCTRAEGYKGDPSADYALCQMTEPVPQIRYENVSTDPKLIKKGGSLLLTGYGCTVPGGAADGIYRLASAKIVSLPGEKEPNTIIMQDQAAICPGDSGGGAYIEYSPKRRLLVSVNSRVIFVTGESYLSSLSSTAGLAFLAQWSKENSDEKICGYNLKGGPCR